MTASAPHPKAWPSASPEKLPRWRGFNLLNLFQRRHHQPFAEDDFRLIRDLGFNFVRLPMDYRIWTAENDWYRIDEAALRMIDDAVAWGEKYFLHVCLNFHRAPGFTVSSPPEPTSLWTDPAALDACAHHWALFARRYRGIPAERLSFNLLNEPMGVDAPGYARVAAVLAQAIRAEDPGRLLLADGLVWGTVPCPDLVPLRLAQCARGYAPHAITHYRTAWVAGSDTWPEPSWPLVQTTPEGVETVLDRRWLAAQLAPWKKLEALGVGVMIGEWGCYTQTPYETTLRWMEDWLITFRELDWGWALWNFRGPFGIIDSGRPGAVYRDLAGHQVDQRMLELLQRY